MAVWRRTVIESAKDWISIVNALENDFRDVVDGGPAVLTGVTLGPAGMYNFQTRETSSRSGSFFIATRPGSSRIWLFTGPPVFSFLVGIIVPGVFAGIAGAALLRIGELLPASTSNLLGVLVGLLVGGGLIARAVFQRDAGDDTDSALIDVMLQASGGRVSPGRARDTIVR